MATTTVSVSFSNGFVGDATKNNEASNSAYLTSLGWSNFQFVQTTNNGLFGGTQGNDYSGTILITDAANVQHRIDGVINWRAPSGNVSTMVFYATGASHTLATTTGTYFIDPYTETNGDPHSFIGLTFNGQTLAISGGKVTGNAATTGLLDTLNTYLANQPQLTVSDVTVNEDGGYATLTVALSKASTDTVTVKYTTQPGTATAGSDYTTTSGTLTFSPGQTTKTVQIAITDDALAEGDETFSLVLSDSSFAAITDNTGVITIRDNDVTQSVTGISVGPAVTEGANLVYTVALNVPSPTPVEYTLGRSGTAGASDYGTLILGSGASWKNGDPTSNTIVVAAGTTSFTITAPTVDDTEIENSETLMLTLGGKSAVGTINDNDKVPFGADLDPRTDNGSSNTDKITSIIQPEFTLSGGPLVRGGTVQLVDSQGRVTGTTAITAADVTAGQVNVKTVPLDDGVYTFQARILDASGQVKAQAPVTVTIVTDRDGVMPSVERAAYNGDFNRDGIADWEQNNVAQLPLASISAYLAGKYAPQQSFGAIMAGTVDALHPGTSVQLTSNAQLADLKVTAAPAPLPANTVAATPMLHFTVTAQTGLQPLSDMDPTRPGLQTRVVIDLPAGGVKANDFFKWNPVSKTWYSFLDDQRLDTFDNGATLLDLNGDGKIDRVVVTLTDGGPGDEDGLVNGTIVDPGMLVFQNLPPAPPAATPVFSIRMASGDRYYTTSAADAARMAQGTGNVLEGARFDSLEGAGSQYFNAYYQPFTKDWYFAADGQPMPYACYQRADGAGFNAALPGQGSGAAFHLYQNAQGLTQLVTVAEAGSLGLAGQGYSDKGVKFSTTPSSAFVFDAEGYLVANRSNASVAALVQTLAGQYHATSEAGFVEAVEQHYLAQVTLVGIPHGSAASAADLNAAFGTHFGV